MKRLFTALSIVITVLTMVSFNATPAKAGCFEAFSRDMTECAQGRAWYERSLCGADAELALAGCVRRTVMG